MGQAIDHSPVSEAREAVEENGDNIAIGEVSRDVPIPRRGPSNPIEQTLLTLPPGASVLVHGMDVYAVRSCVQSFRRAHRVERGAFAVATEGAGVRIWRR